MTDTVECERFLTLSTFLAFVEVHEFKRDNPILSIEECISTVQAVRSDSSYNDFEGARRLLTILDREINWDASKSSLRRFISQIVKLYNPFWLMYVPSGREKVRSVLSRDVSQCFREAGLLDPMPDKSTIDWWDELSALIRGRNETERMLRARYAERLSIEHETRRLSCLGIDKKPEWVSLEDNSIGYDVLSYKWKGSYVVSRLIEVKSTVSNEFYISRNEWNNAASSIDQTVFHVWTLPEETLLELSVLDMKTHIPIDQGSGKWQEVKVTL